MLTKVVNGRTVTCTDAEEAAIRAEWAANAAAPAPARRPTLAAVIEALKERDAGFADALEQKAGRR